MMAHGWMWLAVAMTAACGSADGDTGGGSGAPAGGETAGASAPPAGRGGAPSDPAGASGGECRDATVYVDVDGDGFGTEDETRAVCVAPGDAPEGFAPQLGDCAPTDPLRSPASTEICGDWVDDDCDAADAPCPTTAPSVVAPDFECEGTPPANVYAFARFDDGGRHYAPGACFVFFQSAGAFYLTTRNVSPLTGTTCGSWDQRLTAFSLRGASADCEPIFHDADWPSEAPPGQSMQPASNGCRKFLYSMLSASDFSFVAASEEALSERLAVYDQVEIACIGYRIHSYPWQTIVSTAIELNPGFVAE